MAWGEWIPAVAVRLDRKSGRVQIAKKRGRRNIAAGFRDEDGAFHPIRGSFDYDPRRAGEKPKRRARRTKGGGRRKRRR